MIHMAETLYIGVRGHQNNGQVAAGRRGSVPDSPFPLIVMHNIRTCKVEKKEGGEPGNEATGKLAIYTTNH